MVQLSDIEENKELKGYVKIYHVWETNHVKVVNIKEMAESFGLSILELKKLIGNWLIEQGFKNEEWVRINIHFVM